MQGSGFSACATGNVPSLDFLHTALPAIMQYSFCPCPSPSIAFSYEDCHELLAIGLRAIAVQNLEN